MHLSQSAFGSRIEKIRAMKQIIILVVLSIFIRTAYSAECVGEECQSQCASYCFGVLNPCMSNLANLQRRTEACEAAVAIARIALNDRRLDTFASPLNMQPEKKNTSQLLLEAQPEARKLVLNDHFKQLGSKYYYIEKEVKLNWYEALEKCQRMGAHLASLQNQEELDAFNTQFDGLNRYWIDVTSQFKDDEFISITKGSKANFLSWAEGEPTKDGKCVDLQTVKGKTTMNDNICTVKLLFVCEKPVQQ
ncbi:C-type lectin 37Db [Drosophila ficusphila]|uniref:C-type lectin 37Db n=1 Tax=Drosophila ficusphila TaxID=30025 RepID=UPI0007E71E08|nr:C-type lectin 37Db [Drosophila ficusphila]